MTGFIRKILPQPDGKILLCGHVTGSDTDVWMMRFKSNGRPDTSFGNNGVVIHDFAPGVTDVAQSITLSPDGKIRLVGYLGSTRKILVARFSSGGSLEEHATFEITPNQYAEAADVMLQSDGKLIVAGSTRNPDMTLNGGVFAVARLTE